MPKESDDRLTPPEVLDPLNRIFGPMFDPCPYPRPEWDGLSLAWDSRNFVNPPYSNIRSWVRHARAAADYGKFVAFLIPNDCSTQAFQALRNDAWGKWEIPWRVKFGTPDGRKVDVARSHVVFFLGGLPDASH